MTRAAPAVLGGRGSTQAAVRAEGGSTDPAVQAEGESTVPAVLAGWGATAPSACQLQRPSTVAEAAAALARPSERGAIARGLGRSYGDAAQNSGGTVLATTGLDRILDVDLARETVTVEAGVSLDQLMRALAPLGLFPLVTPGTRQVTIGGAIAADIHGKNHHRDGSFAGHVEEMTIETPALGRLTVSAESHPDYFWCTAGGMGLTGLVLTARLRLQPIESTTMTVDTTRGRDLDEVMAAMVARDQDYRYSVAWVDSLARGRSLGRGVLTQGDHARADDLPAKLSRAERLALPAGARLAAPAWVPSGLLNRATVAAFNEAWFRRAPRRRHGELVPLGTFFHPLDGVVGWNRIYGRRGFVQYQFVVPDSAHDVVRGALETLGGARCPSFLTVLKR
ncbi:MAG: FAD-binding oxidoreductase, partial [Acidimicrobiales bacterium]